MKKIRLNFEGVFELENGEKITINRGDKFNIKGVIEFDEESQDSIKIEKVEKNEELDLEVVSGIGAGLASKAVGEIKNPSFFSEFITLEQFGGKGYYKLIKKGLSFQGSVIESFDPIFSPEDVGKKFCGLFAHHNPLEPDKDEYFPGVIGSRYSLITEFINPNRIKVDFEFNGHSQSGYIFHDNSMAFQTALSTIKNSKHKTLELESGKTYVIPEFTMANIDSSLFIFSKAGSNLKIGWEDYFPWSKEKRKKQDGFIFDIGGNSVEVGFYNVNFLPPHRRIKAAQIFYSSLFKSFPNKDQEFKIAVVNMDTTLEFDSTDSQLNQIGFGFGFLYSSEKGNYVIGKNIVHRGPGFMDFKANFGGGLNAVFENVSTDFQNEEEFASPRIKVRGYLKDNVFTITSGHTIYQIYTYDFGEGNVSHLLHIGRFTFMIDGEKAVINAYQFRVRKIAQGKTRLLVRDSQSVYAKTCELHAGDTLTLNNQVFTIEEKTRTYVTEWMEGDSNVKYAMCLKLDKQMPISSGFHDFYVDSIGEALNNGLEQEAYLIYKSNYEFRTYSNTKFGDSEVLSSDPVGHLSYNHKEITLWAKKFKHRGFYRQSLSGKGSSNGYVLIDCEGFGGQFAPDIEIKNSGDMPEKANLFIRKIEENFSKV